MRILGQRSNNDLDLFYLQHVSCVRKKAVLFIRGTMLIFLSFFVILVCVCGVCVGGGGVRGRGRGRLWPIYVPFGFEDWMCWCNSYYPKHCRLFLLNHNGSRHIAMNIRNESLVGSSIHFSN